MMRVARPDLSFRYYETDELQILELPYKGDNLSMMIILPKENNISEVEGMMTYDNLMSWRNSLAATAVEVFLPKFTLETEYNLKQVLVDMGMNIPFTDEADFSGMNGNKELHIEKVIHKAFVEVTEEGTEAAGATSVHMVLTSTPNSVTFNANHPFIFLIQHESTGNILFMGKMCNPE
jgi:serpin B